MPSTKSHHILSRMDDDVLMEDMDFFDVDNPDDDRLVMKRNLSNEHYITICMDCLSKGTILYDQSDGIIVCTNCGVELGKIMDYSPEWNNYEGKGVARCSNITDVFCPMASMSMPLGVKNNKMNMLHTWNIMPYHERALLKILKEIHIRCVKGEIPKCIEDDAKIMLKYIGESKHLFGEKKGKKRITRGGNHRSIIAACVFYACRRGNKPRTHKEIAELFGITKKLLTKGCKNFGEIMKNCNIEFINNPVCPEHYVPRFCKLVGILDKNKVDEIVKNTTIIRKLNFASNHTPVALVAATILFHSEGVSGIKKDIINKLEVSEATLDKAYKKIIGKSDIILDSDKVQKCEEKMKSLKKNKEMPLEFSLLCIENDLRFREINRDLKLEYDNMMDRDFDEIFKRDNLILNL